MRYLFLTLSLNICVYVFGAENEIDYLSYNYRFLDEELNIVITPSEFDSLLNVDGVSVDRIKSRNDSLSVIMYHEFENYSDVLKAYNRVKFSWLRLAYHVWMSEEEVREYAVSIGADAHPWRCMEALYDDIENPKVMLLLKELKDKVEMETGEDLPDDIEAIELLNIALKVNPKRISDLAEVKARRAAYQKEHGKVDESKIGVACGKPNCCQN